jgi:nucleoside-diphosphate-sugar epimerase
VKVLLTGADGFLGRYAHKTLSDKGIQTVAIGRRHDTLGAIDLLDTHCVDAVVEHAGATHLLHLAWYVEHRKFWQSPLNADWVEATAYLSKVFLKSGGRRIVGAGTCFEYAHGSAPLREDTTPLLPATPYGAAKDAAHRRVMDIAGQSGASCAWARIFVPYGAGENPQRIVPSVIAALKGERPPFGVNRKIVRDFIHAEDTAEALAALILDEGTGAYNVCTGEGATIETIVHELAAQLGADPAPILSLPSHLDPGPEVVIGAREKIDTIGWRPRLSLQAGLRRTIADLSSRAAKP